MAENSNKVFHDGNYLFALYMGGTMIAEYGKPLEVPTDLPKKKTDGSALFDMGTDECKKKNFDFPGNSRYWSHTTMKFHTSYNWFMPVFFQLGKDVLEDAAPKAWYAEYCYLRELDFEKLPDVWQVALKLVKEILTHKKQK